MKTANKTARLTTNIDAHLLQFLDEWAKAENRTRREMLEIALHKAEIKRIGDLMYECGNNLADSPEMQMWLDIANDPVNLSVGLE
ncbi:MAG: hypothetical protein A2542_01185 [Parcubacteria group bacterium RIFOXYD2_FULL_52_8]|nr:MAG: hypothetical protein A2542_01185 [Parcubacteria group bacterium RIFOXYD2_FULL_52_8]